MEGFGPRRRQERPTRGLKPQMVRSMPQGPLREPQMSLRGHPREPKDRSGESPREPREPQNSPKTVPKESKRRRKREFRGAPRESEGSVSTPRSHVSLAWTVLDPKTCFGKKHTKENDAFRVSAQRVRTGSKKDPR